MKAGEVIQELASAGVHLYLDGDRLRFRAKPGAYTPAHRALVAQHKPGLLAALSATADTPRDSKHPDKSLVSKEEIPRPEPPAPRPKPLAAVHAPPVRAAPWPADLVDWASRLTPADLPPAPFRLRPGITVNNSERWLARFQFDLSAGPTAPRAQTGAIQRDLANLAELLGFPKGD